MTDVARPSRVVGVLGGMGPAATVDFYDKLVRTTPAQVDQEHLRIVIWADPTVPNRHAALSGDGPDPVPWLEQGVDRLIDSGAEIVVSPCNTAHAFLPDVMAGRDVEFLSIIDTAVDEVVDAAEGDRVGLLAADGALSSGLYQRALCSAGKDPVLPADSTQRELMDLIFRMKSAPATEHDVKELGSIVQELVGADATSVLVGCTELSMLVADVRAGAPLVDASEALARRTVLRAR